jgi:hypothetical protein
MFTLFSSRKTTPLAALWSGRRLDPRGAGSVPARKFFVVAGDVASELVLSMSANAAAACSAPRDFVFKR